MIPQNKVLLIDDEASLLFGLSVIMKREGYEVITAKDGSDGFQKAQSENPDIIISDVMMPSPNGFELREMLNQNEATNRIPFIFLTAKVEQEDKIRGIVGGADDYITKPFDRRELVARVESILRRSRIEQEQGKIAANLAAQEELEKLKKEIMQNVRHELRTPLVNVMLPLELAISNKFNEPVDQVNFINTALTNVERLQSMVEDFILLAETDNGALNTLGQEINFKTIIVPAINKRVLFYKDKHLNLEIINSVNDEFLGPRNEVKRAILHLIDNACKFSSPGGRITLEATRSEQDELTIIVSDQGPGIPASEHDLVFNKFYQISQGSSRKYEGLGVGLTIARAIARSLGGDVEILESTSGTKVSFHIPFINARITTSQNNHFQIGV